MNLFKLSFIFLLFVSCTVTNSGLFSQSSTSESFNSEDLRSKTKRLSNKIGACNVLMIGTIAMHIDERYQNELLNPIDFSGERVRDLYQFGSGRSATDRRAYNSSFNDYNALYKEMPYQIRRFRDLCNYATQEELVALTDHKSPAVRCYAFWALLEEHYPGSKEILINHLNDNEIVKTFDDEDVYQHKVGDYFLKLMTNGTPAHFTKKLSDEEYEEIMQSIIADESNALSSKEEYLIKLPATEDSRTALKKFIQLTNSGKALVRLAEFQDERDLALIKKFFRESEGDNYYALQAARNFPDPSFTENLLGIHSNELTKRNNVKEIDLLILYQALVQIDDPAIKEALESGLKVKKRPIREAHAKYIWLALQKFPESSFIDIKSKINIDAKRRRAVLRYIEY